MKLPCQNLHGLPELAGLTSFSHAAAPGLSIQEVVDCLKRSHFLLVRLWQALLTRLTAEPIYEVKMLFSYHAYLCAELATTHRERVAEMRHPPLGLEKIPHPALDLLCAEILHAPTLLEMCSGIYDVLLPALQQAWEQQLTATNPLADAPTVRLLRHGLMDLAEMISGGQRTVLALQPEAEPPHLLDWHAYLRSCLSAAGGIAGDAPQADPPPPRASAQPRPYDRSPQRDQRFPDPYNMGVHAEAFLYDPHFSAADKTLMLYYKRLREIDVPEMMASILVELNGQPWEFYRDLTRQLWDEARHAMMGEVGFVSAGIDWAKFVMINFTWSKGLNEQLTPTERHAVLWFIEQGLMTKTGKRYEWEVGQASGDALAATFQDYDWADEVLHARIGRDWYVKNFDGVDSAAAYGSACWSKVVSGWETWRQAGKTAHHNWWPALYTEACRLRGVEPDPAAAAFATTYADTRADLQRIAQSG